MQNEKCKIKEQSGKEDLSERFLNFGAGVIKFSMRLDRTSTGRYISGQLVRSGTSAGANYEEACSAQSRADFVHKLQIVLKELRESCFWLRLVKKTALIVESDANFSTLLQESKELANIIAKSIITAKGK